MIMFSQLYIVGYLEKFNCCLIKQNNYNSLKLRYLRYRFCFASFKNRLIEFYANMSSKTNLFA